MGSMWKTLRIVVLIVAALYLGFVYLLHSYQREMMYLPPDAISPASAVNLSGFEETVVMTADNIELTGFYLKPQKADAPMLIVFHGNAGHPAYLAGRFRSIARNMGVGVLLTEYRGYSGQAGTPSEEGLLNDARAFVTWWRSQPGMEKHKLILYGESLGGAVAAQIAAEAIADAIILEAPFDSALAMAESKYPYVPYMEFLLQDDWRTDLALAELKIPKLLLVGERDTVIPAWHARHLFDVAAPPKTMTIYSAAGHDNIYKYGAIEEFNEFLDTLK